MKVSFNKFIEKLGKQRNTSPRIGALIHAYSSTAILYSPLTLIGVATTVYGLWGRDMITEWLPWFTFPMLVGCMVGFILIMMVFFYKVIIPSQVAWSVQQDYKHRNPLVKDIQKVIKNQGEFKETLERHELPFDVKEIRKAKDPLTAVSNGLLIKTLADVK